MREQKGGYFLIYEEGDDGKMRVQNINGYTILRGVIPADPPAYIEAYNLTHNIFGHGSDMQDWDNAGDTWGDFQECYEDNGEWTLIFSEDQLSDEELEEFKILRQILQIEDLRNRRFHENPRFS